MRDSIVRSSNPSRRDSIHRSPHQDSDEDADGEDSLELESEYVPKTGFQDDLSESDEEEDVIDLGQTMW
jgi:hypothetical protein